jgi:hypothetical protein
MIKGGKGGGKTITGLHFEKRASLKSVIKQINGYSIENNSVYFNDDKVAEVYTKNDIYKKLLEPRGIDYKKLISRKLLPDDSIFVLSKNTLFIIEIKFQETPGSVDEKLQTCDFKKKQYQKLMHPLNISVEYIYVLNDWFKKPEYKDVLDYIVSVGCKYYFNEIPLKDLGLPVP